MVLPWAILYVEPYRCTMKLSICDHHSPFRPGDAIKGYVELNPKESHVEKMHVVLEGRAKTKTLDKRGDSRSVCRARAPLLYAMHTLQMEVAVLDSDGGRTVPFLISIPPVAPKLFNVPTNKDGFFKPYWTYDWGKPKEHFQYEAGHVLPPTFRAGPCGMYTKSEGYVEYSITAIGSQLIPAREGGTKLESCLFDTVPFWMQSPCPVLTEEVKKACRINRRVTVQSMKLLPEMAARDGAKSTFKEKWKSVMGSSKPPEVSFCMSLVVPGHVHAGENMPLSVKMQRAKRMLDGDVTERKSRPQVPFPGVEVEKLEINIKHCTRIRTCGSMKMHTDDWSHTAWTDIQVAGLGGVELPVWDGDDVVMATSSAVSLDESKESCMASKRQQSDMLVQSFRLSSGQALPSRIVPTFSTYNISRTYSVRVTLTLRCAGEIKYINYTGPISVLSRPRAAGSSGHPAMIDILHQGDQLERPLTGSTLAEACSSLDDNSVERVDSGHVGEEEEKKEKKKEKVEDWGEYKLTSDDGKFCSGMAWDCEQGW